MIVANLKEHALITVQTTKEGLISATGDAKVHWVVALGTFLSSFTTSEVAQIVAIFVSLSLIAKNVFDTRATIKKTYNDDVQATMKRETERAKQRSIQKAESLGQPARRESDN